MSAISCSRSFWRSSSAARSSSRFGALRPRLRLWCVPHMVTSLLSAFEKVCEAVAKLLDGLEPRREQVVACVGQRVGALRRAPADRRSTRRRRCPRPRAREASCTGCRRRHDLLRRAPARARAARSRASDAAPATRAAPAPRSARPARAPATLRRAPRAVPSLPGAMSSPAMHGHSICNLHMSVTTSCEREPRASRRCPRAAMRTSPRTSARPPAPACP